MPLYFGETKTKVIHGNHFFASRYFLKSVEPSETESDYVYNNESIHSELENIDSSENINQYIIS